MKKPGLMMKSSGMMLIPMWKNQARKMIQGKKLRLSLQTKRPGGLAKRGKEGKNRRSRDAKFGHGGRKGLKKQNTAETTNDFRSFNKGGESQNKKRKRA